MRLHVSAIGRLRAGPEQDLISEYTARFLKAGRAHGFSALQMHETEAKKSDMALEAPLLLKPMPEGATLITLDERGKLLSSPEFSKLLARTRDDGVSDLGFLIGGADGLHPELRAKAHHSISFGKMVWPHKLARVMLAEQLYRAASIIAGSPYHRD